MMETWKPVVGFEGMYAVSNTGRVKRVACVVKTERGQRVFAERLKALVERDMNGYPQVLVTLSKNNKAIEQVNEQAYIYNNKQTYLNNINIDIGTNSNFLENFENKSFGRYVRDSKVKEMIEWINE